MIWLTLLLLLFCALVAWVPQEVAQVALAGVWVLMAVGGAGVVVWELARRL